MKEMSEKIRVYYNNKIRVCALCQTPITKLNWDIIVDEDEMDLLVCSGCAIDELGIELGVNME